MRVGLVLTHFFMLLLAATAALLLWAWSWREFPDVATPPGTAARLTPRCLALAVADPAARWIPLPGAVQLTARPARGARMLPPPAGWYDARASDLPDLDARRLREGLDGPLRWRPVGADSLELMIPWWPVGARLRVATRGDTLHGRLVGYGDSAGVLPFNGGFHVITWPPVYDVRAIRVPCVSRHAR